MAKKTVKKNSRGKSGSDDSVICAVLAYFLVGIIWYFVDEKMKKNSLAKFHTKQALVLLIADVMIMIAASVLGAILFVIPIVGAAIMSLIWAILSIAIFVLWIIGIINAANRKENELPIIGHFADKLTF